MRSTKKEGWCAMAVVVAMASECFTACCFCLPTQHLLSLLSEKEEGDDKDDIDDDGGGSEWHDSGDEHGVTTSGGIETFEPDESFFGQSVKCGKSKVPVTLLPLPVLGQRQANPMRDATLRRTTMKEDPHQPHKTQKLI